MKSGFVALVGRSNVGKSTLINTLVGTKIAAVSFRPQMTRNIIHGVVNAPEGQAIFVDTPGVFQNRRSRLTGKLQQKIHEAIQDIDLILYVVDPTREIGGEERASLGIVRNVEIPKILVINKTDTPVSERPFQESYEQLAKDFDAVFHVSALHASHIKPLMTKVMELLPEGEAMYPDDQITNVSKEFWIAEIVREKLFSILNQEVPYTVTVEVDKVEEKKDMIVVTARVLTSDERYKKMIIGHAGKRVKEVGQMARKELEAATNSKMFLDLTVEVDPHWVERI